MLYEGTDTSRQVLSIPTNYTCDDCKSLLSPLEFEQFKRQMLTLATGDSARADDIVRRIDWKAESYFQVYEKACNLDTSKADRFAAYALCWAMMDDYNHWLVEGGSLASQDVGQIRYEKMDQ